MAYKYNPLLSIGLDDTGAGGGGTPGGSDTQVQFNDGGSFGGSADLTWDDTGKVLGVGGDIDLDDGGTYATTLQVITPTANRTISYPDATGTLALVAGSSGQLIYNNAGANAGAPTLTYDGSILTSSGRFINSYNATASSPAKAFTGTWFTGGTATTTKPQVLIEPTGTTSTAWSTSGTGFGVNAASGFAGNLLDLQVNGTSQLRATSTGQVISLAGFTSSEHAGLRMGGDKLLNASGADIVASPGIGGGIVISGSARFLRVENVTGTNFERGKLAWSSNVFQIGTEKGGSGTARPLELQTDGTTRLTVGATGGFTVTDAQNIALGTTTGTKIGTATNQKLGFYNATPVVQPTAVTDITTTATSGSLPTPDGTVTIADATTPTVTELLEYCVELEAKLEAALGHLRTLGLIAT